MLEPPSPASATPAGPSAAPLIRQIGDAVLGAGTGTFVLSIFESGDVQVRNNGLMSAVKVANAVRRWLLDNDARGWAVEVSDESGWTITLEHPASHGLVLETNTSDEAAAVERAEQWISNIVEISIASAAPVLTHPDLVREIRGLAAAFEWQQHEVAGVARMLESHEVIAKDEADWLAERVGIAGRDSSAWP